MTSTQATLCESALPCEQQTDEQQTEKTRKKSTAGEGAMLNFPRPTPTCTRFQTTAEMACIKCNERMRLVLIEPREGHFNLLTYSCTACPASEAFLKAI
jgi:hypothetical protein